VVSLSLFFLSGLCNIWIIYGYVRYIHLRKTLSFSVFSNPSDAKLSSGDRDGISIQEDLAGACRPANLYHS
jgi:hypothetical protein